MNDRTVHTLGTGLIGILLLTGTVLLFKGGPDYYAPRSLNNIWDLGHILYFALLALLLSRWPATRRIPLIWLWTGILFITLVSGLSIEVLQYGTARTPNAGDLLRDLTGSLLVLVFGPPGKRLTMRHLRWFLQLSVLLFTLAQFWPLSRSLIDEAIARYQFPLLSGFDTPFELDRWEGGRHLSVEPATTESTDRALKLTLTTDQYSGATLKYFDGNWSSARTLQTRLYNPGTTPVHITCRIHDDQHIDHNEVYSDRFNRSFALQPGWNRIEIDLDEVRHAPSSRSMDMSRIRAIIFFTVLLPAPRVLYIDEVRLTY